METSGWKKALRVVCRPLRDIGRPRAVPSVLLLAHHQHWGGWLSVPLGHSARTCWSRGPAGGSGSQHRGRSSAHGRRVTSGEAGARAPLSVLPSWRTWWKGMWMLMEPNVNSHEFKSNVILETNWESWKAESAFHLLRYFEMGKKPRWDQSRDSS